MVGPIDVKQKVSASVGYWIQYVTLTLYLTHDLDLGCFKVIFRNNSISGIAGLIDVKWKRSELIWYWADCMTLPLDHIHDPDPGVEISSSESEIALSQERDGRLTWNENDVSHPFITMISASVTMVGWADIPDSDWGDFSRRCAVDISSYECYMHNPHMNHKNYLSVQPVQYMPVLGINYQYTMSQILVILLKSTPTERTKTLSDPGRAENVSILWRHHVSYLVISFSSLWR